MVLFRRTNHSFKSFIDIYLFEGSSFSCEFESSISVWHREGGHVPHLGRDVVVARPRMLVIFLTELLARAKAELVTGELCLAFMASRSRVVIEGLSHGAPLHSRPKVLLGKQGSYE